MDNRMHRDNRNFRGSSKPNNNRGRGRGFHQGERQTNYQRPSLGQLPSTSALPKSTDSVVGILQKPKSQGTVGQPNYVCTTNYFGIKFNERFKGCFCYSVRFLREGGVSEEVENKAVRKERKLKLAEECRIFSQIKKNHFGDYLPVYVGNQRAFALGRLLDVEAVVEYDSEKWRITLTYDSFFPMTNVREGPDYMADSDGQKELSALAGLFNYPALLNYTPIGRGFYGLPGFSPISIGEGLELWKGFKQHVLPGSKEVFLNLNSAVTLFFESGPLIAVIPKILGLKGMPDTLKESEIRRLGEKLLHCRVQTKHLDTKRKFCIQGFTNKSASEQKFVIDGRSITVAEYFRQKHKPLKFPRLPCIKKGLGSKQSFYPIEVLDLIRGNPYRGDQTPRMIREIIKIAAVQPQQRLGEIRTMIGQLKGSCDFEEFGVEIAKEVDVVARILPPSDLVASKPVKTTPGVIHMGENSVRKGCSIQRWTVVATDEYLDERQVERFAEIFVNQAKPFGVNLSSPIRINGRLPKISGNKEHGIVEQNIKNLVEENDIEFVLFLLSDHTTIHSTVKFVADVVLGVPSKCVRSSTVLRVTRNDRRGPDQCILNILYGLNPKFEGENVVGSRSEFGAAMLALEPTFIMGMDVNHGHSKMKQGLPRMPSTVGIVGTRNLNGTLYTAAMRAQIRPPSSDNREIVQKAILKPTVVEMLKNFRAETGQWPKRYIVFRDGLSDGEFVTSLELELRTIIEACEELMEGNRPAITFIVVTKRHDTRLFPLKFETSYGGKVKQNPVAGTVVDSKIVSPKVWSFFLVSHEGIQGTSRPAQYNVLYDENKFNSDQLQSLSYYFCHLYGKCPRVVSLPAPLYYAHHAAYRASELGTYRFLREHSDTFRNNGRLTEEQIHMQEERLLKIYQGAISVNPAFSKRMFFL